ncbi:hypothetical protein NDU88_000781 [Pleurodeles waltl]|uniref:RNase H type-1 domain-containing protein n=1 Tax=Pleurodeles waltl TaxID=8319 RepID=A0AAV7NDQ3_PLEWA|nr:hypothetical protein NDU88_000781 [Pleurodeles waltl]
MKQWRKLTEKEGCLAFPEYGTFNMRILARLRWMLSEQKPPPRPAQYEALTVWDLMALKQKQEKFQKRLRKAEKSYAEARNRSSGISKQIGSCLWEDLNTLFEIIVPPDLWLECKRGVDWPTKEPARDKVTGAPSEEVMKYYHKVIEFLKQKVSPKVTYWQKIDRTSQEVKESIHAYYERLLKAFKHYSGTETIEPKDMNHLVFRFVEGLRPEVSQMIKNHLICWQAKPIDEVLQYAKYCSDEIELKQKKLKEKVMVMQIRAAQAGIQGNGVQQMIQQQPQMNGVFQTQPRGRGQGFVNRSSDMNTVVIQNDTQGVKKMSPCHACGGVGHWKQECPNMVQDGAVQQGVNVGALQNSRGLKMRHQNPNFQNNSVQMQGVQPMQQMQMPRFQSVQLQPVQQKILMVPRQQMQLPMAPMGQQQVMVPQQVTGQVMSQNNTVQQFPLRGENSMNGEWSDDSSDSEECRLAASLEVDQRGPYVEGKVMGYKVLFLVDTGATRSTVRSVEVPKLPLSGRTIRVVGVANQYLTNPVTDPVQVEIGNFQGLHRYETIILGSPNVSLKRCSVLNPATLLPVENTEIKNEEEFEHDCLEVTELCTKPRPDIQDTQLKENDCIMFVDGSFLRDSAGTLRAGYAVCTITGIVEASWLERVFSAQVAELIALTKACHAAVNLKVTIYTDSRYGFGIVLDFVQLWSQRGFMTSSGSPVKNGEHIKDLLHAIQLPLEISVLKCSAHTRSQDFGGDSNFGGRRRPPAEVPPPKYRSAVERPLRVFWDLPWAGGRPPKGCPPAHCKSTFPLRCRLRIEPAEWEGATGAVAPVAYFSVC